MNYFVKHLIQDHDGLFNAKQISVIIKTGATRQKVSFSPQGSARTTSISQVVLSSSEATAVFISRFPTAMQFGLQALSLLVKVGHCRYLYWLM